MYSERDSIICIVLEAELKLMLAKLSVIKNVAPYLSSKAENTVKFQLNFRNLTEKKAKQKQSRNRVRDKIKMM